MKTVTIQSFMTHANKVSTHIYTRCSQVYQNGAMSFRWQTFQLFNTFCTCGNQA